MRRRVVLGVVATMLIAAAPARAVETIGSDLSATPDTAPPCSVECTVVQDGVTSPIRGVIVRWRVKLAGQTTMPIRLQVLNGGGSVTADGPESPNADAITTFSTRMLILQNGQISLLLTGAAKIVAPGSAQVHVFEPPSNPVATDIPGELLINADIEPDTDGDVFGDQTQDNCVGVPNAEQADRDHDGRGDACDPCPDAAGASGCPPSASPPANQPPTARFRTPTTGSTVGPTVQIALDAADDSGAPAVSVFDDDGTICVLRAAPYTCTWTPTGADVGRATLLASAVDAVGLSSLAIVRVRVSRFAATLTKKAKRRGGRTTVTGKLVLPSVVTRAEGCHGTVTVRVRKAKKAARLSKRCTYSAKLRVRTGAPRVSFAGNAVIAPST